ncbi:MAG: hypothetical protein RI956_826 [Pseudomonadota bacterium]|jgi:coenzyme F420-reducing hydrogenase gamma subunit
MKKIITAILATAFVTGMAMSPAHATDNQTSAKAAKPIKKPIVIDGSCRGCPSKGKGIKGNDAS